MLLCIKIYFIPVGLNGAEFRKDTHWTKVE